MKLRNAYDECPEDGDKGGAGSEDATHDLPDILGGEWRWRWWGGDGGEGEIRIPRD